MDYSNIVGATDVAQVAFVRHVASGKLVAIWTTFGGGTKIHAATVDEGSWIVSSTIVSMASGLDYLVEIHLQTALFYDPSTERIILLGGGGENIFSWTVTGGEAADAYGHAAFDFSAVGNYMLNETNRVVGLGDGYFGGLFTALYYDVVAGFHFYRMVGTTCTHVDFWELDPDYDLYYPQNGTCVAAGSQGDKVVVAWGIHSNTPTIDAIRFRIGNRVGATIVWEDMVQIDLPRYPQEMHGGFVAENKFVIMSDISTDGAHFLMVDVSGTGPVVEKSFVMGPGDFLTGNSSYGFLLSNPGYNYITFVWREYLAPNKVLYMKHWTKDMNYSSKAIEIETESNEVDARIDWYENGFYEYYPNLGWLAEGEKIQFVLAMFDQTVGDSESDTEAYMWTVEGGPFEPFWTNYHGQTEYEE